MVVLTCKLRSDIDRGSSVAWYMNNKETLILPSNSNFSRHPDRENNIHKIVFNATARLNDHSIYHCLIHGNVDSFWSNAAPVLILDGECMLLYYTDKIIFCYNYTDTVSRNPWLIEKQDFFHVMWSPPYLWRGHYIDYFNITITDLNDGSIMYKRVNVSENLNNRHIESYIHTIHGTCSELLFEIRAVNSYNGLLDGTHNVSGRFPGGYLCAAAECYIKHSFYNRS